MVNTLQLPKTLQEAVAFFSDPQRTFDYAVKLRWPDGTVTCPRCNSTEHSFISTRGVYFATGLAIRVGEAVEVLLEIPRRVTGTNGGIRRFAGRVTHVESKNMAEGISGIGVQLLYYERDLGID